jgi:hypothetical protein
VGGWQLSSGSANSKTGREKMRFYLISWAFYQNNIFRAAAEKIPLVAFYPLEEIITRGKKHSISNKWFELAEPGVVVIPLRRPPPPQRSVASRRPVV